MVQTMWHHVRSKNIVLPCVNNKTEKNIKMLEGERVNAMIIYIHTSKYIIYCILRKNCDTMMHVLEYSSFLEKY